MPNQSPVGRSNLFKAAFWMLLSTLSFLGLMIAVRQLAATTSVFQMLTVRSVIALLILVIVGKFLGRSDFRTSRFKLHLTRNLFHFTGQYCWAVAVILLPLAEVIAIEFTTPIWVVLLASLFLKERLTLARVAALAAGLIGVLIVVRPGFEQVQIGTFIALFATVGFAGASFTTKKLTSTDSTWTILLYMSLLQLIIGIGPAIATWTWPVGMDYFWLFIVGISGLTAHIGLTNALSLADTATILPLDYLRLPATFVIGALLYQESLDNWVLLGASIIFIANYLHLRQESKTQPRRVKPEPG